MPHEADCGLRADYTVTMATVDQWLALMDEIITAVKAEGGDEVDVYQTVMAMVQERLVVDVQEGALGRPVRALTVALIRLVEMTTIGEGSCPRCAACKECGRAS